MKYDDNHYREMYDPDGTEAEAIDDRIDGSVSMDEQDAFNNPEDRVAHL